MTQAINWWFGQNYLHLFLFAQDETGKTHRVQTRWKDGEPIEKAEMRCIVRMQKTHALRTEF
jgi:hypothetical protein